MYQMRGQQFQKWTATKSTTVGAGSIKMNKIASLGRFDKAWNTFLYRGTCTPGGECSQGLWHIGNILWEHRVCLLPYSSLKAQNLVSDTQWALNKYCWIGEWTPVLIDKETKWEQLQEADNDNTADIKPGLIGFRIHVLLTILLTLWFPS